MIKIGSTVIVRTKDAIYCVCELIAMSDKNITVGYFAGMKKDRATGKLRPDHRVDIISRSKIINISERT